MVPDMHLTFQLNLQQPNSLSFFDTGATISCMSKAHFDKLDPKPFLTTTCTYRVNGADGNSLGSLGTNT